MLRFSTCQVFDLLAAGDARRHNLDLSASRFNRRRETAIADRQRQIVMFFFEAEGAGHAAAARVDFVDFKTCRLENRNCRCGSDESLLMAVAVEQCLAIAVPKVQGQLACIEFPHQKFFQQKAVFRDPFGLVGSKELRVFVSKGE